MNVAIGKLKNNPKNPRVIRDEKFNKLKKSIEEFPDMLTKRPLVVFTDKDGKFVVLGGNMRLKAAKELGIKELPVIVADEWTEEQKAEFLIKDNVNFGEWNHEELANEWDEIQLQEWGLDLPVYSAGHDANDINEMELDLDEEFDPLGHATNLHRIVFMFDNENEAKKWYEEKLHNEYNVKKFGGMQNKMWQINLSSVYGK